MKMKVIEEIRDYRRAREDWRLKEMGRLTSQVQELKRNIMAWQEEDPESNKYRGNDYQSYESQLKAMNDKYLATAKWGVLQVGAIVDLRAAFIMGDGPEVVVKGEGGEEAEFMTRLLQYNNLDFEASQEFAKEAELEGKILLKLEWAKEAQTVSVRFISYFDKRYYIKSAEQDYLEYVEAKWRPKKGGAEEILKAPDFVYTKFGGRVYDPNSASAKTMKCLTQIDRLDRALFDLRKIDKLFAAPTPHVETDDKKQAQQIITDVKALNWRIGKFLAHTGKMGILSPAMEGAKTLIEEIAVNAKIVSGATGVPVHFLGFPEFMSNRSTSEDLVMGLGRATSKERLTWNGVFDEIGKKSIEIANAQLKKKLDPDKVGVKIAQESPQAWDNIKNVLLPMALAGKISDETLLSFVPGIDVQAELARVVEREGSELVAAKAELDELRADRELRMLEDKDGAAAAS